MRLWLSDVGVSVHLAGVVVVANFSDLGVSLRPIVNLSDFAASAHHTSVVVIMEFSDLAVLQIAFRVASLDRAPDCGQNCFT